MRFEFRKYLTIPFVCTALLFGCGERETPAGPEYAHLELAGQWDSPGYATDVAVAGDYAYLADDQAGFHVINITDPANPELVGTYGTSYGGVTILDVAPSINLLAIVNNRNAQYYYNITNPDSLSLYDGSGGSTQTNDLLTRGIPSESGSDSLMLFMGDSNDGVRFSLYEAFEFGGLISWAGIASSETQDTLTRGRALGLSLDGLLLLSAQDQLGLVLYDYTNFRANPAPRLRSFLDTPGSARNVATRDSLAYIADGRFGLQIIAYDNPDSLEWLSGVEVPGYANDIAVSGQYVCLATGDGGSVLLDVSTPTAPAVVSQYTSPYTNAVTASGDVFLVADRDAGLLLFRITN